MWDAQKQADRRAFPGRFRWGRFLGLLSLWALLWGFWSAISVSQDLREHDRARGDERRARQDRVRSAAHELALALARAAAEVQVRATALWATARAGQPSAPAQFGPGILHWAEVYADEQGLLGVRRQFRGPRWELSSTLV